MKTMGKMKVLLLSLLLIPLTLPAMPANADTQYVSDRLVITLREGKGAQYKVITYLKTGTPLDVLKEEGEFLMVRTEKGEEGWVRKKYITSETPKPVIIERLKDEIGRLKAKVEKAEKARDSLQDELKAAGRDRSAQVKELQKLVDEARKEASRTAEELQKVARKHTTLLEESKDVVKLIEERDTLRAESQRLAGVERFLLEENKKLERRKDIWWLVAGGGLLFLGWIIGKASRQKRFY